MSGSTPGPERVDVGVYKDRWEIVLDGMRRMILTGEMEPGSKISETELAAKFAVSRGPIRESLRALEVAGLVIREPRKSSYVAPVRAADVEEVYCLREAVEVLAIQRSLTLHHDLVISDLQTQLERLEEVTSLAAQDTPQIVEADINFHDVFYRHSDHSRLQGVWHGFSDPLRIMMRLSSIRPDLVRTQGRAGHIAIAEAAIRGDIDACVKETRAHLDVAKTNVLAVLDSQQAPGVAAGPR